MLSISPWALMSWVIKKAEIIHTTMMGTRRVKRVRGLFFIKILYIKMSVKEGKGKFLYPLLVITLKLATYLIWHAKQSPEAVAVLLCLRRCVFATASPTESWTS